MYDPTLDDRTPEEQAAEGQENPKVFMVDDQAYCHAMVKNALGKFCTLLSFDDGESAVTAATIEMPALILMDVEMPGMGGYAACQKIKKASETADIPVVFLSANDKIEDRLMGYWAGGHDYITKPFDLQELQAKVRQMLEQVKQHTELKSRVISATSTAMLVMTSMGEMGVVLEVMKRFNACMKISDLAREILTGTANYGLQGVVQIRTPGEKLTLSEAGAGTPLEESIIEHMAKMDRITEFKSRLSITYDHVSLLINGMPQDDPERSGRLRDYLAILADAADARVQAIIAMQESRLRKMIEQTASSITEALAELDNGQRLHRLEASAAVNKLMEHFEQALHKVSMSDAQEEFLRSTVREGVERLIHLQSDELKLQNKLTVITGNLNNTLKR